MLKNKKNLIKWVIAWAFVIWMVLWIWWLLPVFASLGL